MSSDQTVWREGQRIRRTDGAGYHDRVPDWQIVEHLGRDDDADPLSDSFARAVLAIREFERAAAFDAGWNSARSVIESLRQKASAAGGVSDV